MLPLFFSSSFSVVFFLSFFAWLVSFRSVNSFVRFLLDSFFLFSFFLVLQLKRVFLEQIGSRRHREDKLTDLVSLTELVLEEKNKKIKRSAKRQKNKKIGCGCEREREREKNVEDSDGFQRTSLVLYTEREEMNEKAQPSYQSRLYFTSCFFSFSFPLSLFLHLLPSFFFLSSCTREISSALLLFLHPTFLSLSSSFFVF